MVVIVIVYLFMQVIHIIPLVVDFIWNNYSSEP
jgi:hypothetical protein